MSICPVDLNLRSPQLSSPVDLKYTASHEWVRSNADGTVTVGITAHAQDALGELVYVELEERRQQEPLRQRRYLDEEDERTTVAR